MIRTQIQLPDTLYARSKAIAQRHEISLAELVRRGLEHMLRLYPVDANLPDGWSLPESLALGALKAPVQQWRELANSPRDESSEAAR